MLRHQWCWDTTVMSTGEYWTPSTRLRPTGIVWSKGSYPSTWLCTVCSVWTYPHLCPCHISSGIDWYSCSVSVIPFFFNLFHQVQQVLSLNQPLPVFAYCGSASLFCIIGITCVFVACLPVINFSSVQVPTTGPTIQVYIACTNRITCKAKESSSILW